MKHRARRVFLYYGLFLLRLFILCLPRVAYLQIAKWAGYAVYRVLRKEREKTERHLKFAFGSEKSEEEIRRISRGVFEHLGQNLAEWISSGKYNPSNISSFVETDGLEKIRTVLARGRGGVLLASHFGNWELLGPALLMNLQEVRTTVVVRRIYYPRLNDFLVRMRRSAGLDMMYRDDPPREMLRVLKRNHLLGLLPDQDIDSVDGIFVDFFGKPCHTPIGPAAIARAARTVLIPIFIIRQGARHRFEVSDPIEVGATGDKDQEIRKATEAWTRVLEGYIRRYPEQWVWMHPRWKTQK